MQSDLQCERALCLAHLLMGGVHGNHPVSPVSEATVYNLRDQQ